MEATKFWTAIILVSIVAAIVSGMQYFQGVDDANRSLQDIKDKLTQMRESVKHIKGEWERVEGNINRAQAAQAKSTPFATKRDELQSKYRGLEGDFKYLVKSMRTIVDKARVDGVGASYPEIKLSNGKILKDAKIRKIEESQITFIHADGSGVVTFDLLPDEISGKFDLGPNGLANSLAAAEKDIFTAALTKTVAVKTSSPSTNYEPDTTPKTKGDPEKTKKLRMQIVDLESKITAANAAVEGYNQQAQDNLISGDNSKAKGTPGAKYYTLAAQFSQQAQAMKAQALTLEAAKKKLEVELEFAREGN